MCESAVCADLQNVTKWPEGVYKSKGIPVTMETTKYLPVKYALAASQFRGCILQILRPTKAHEGHAFVGHNG